MTTISTIIDDLVREGLVQQADDSDMNRYDGVQRGRPATQYTLDKQRWAAIGVQVTSDAIMGAMVRLDGTVLTAQHQDVAADVHSDVVLQEIRKLIEALIHDSVGNQENVLGIGVALEGLVDVENGISLSMPFRQHWQDVSIRENLLAKFSLPVIVDWRVYAATLAEALYGEGRGVSDFAYLNVDTGVAGAIVASNMLVRSNNQRAGSTGDFGHVLTTSGPRLCYCGNTGCIQTEITTQALLAQLHELTSNSQGHGNFWQTHELTLQNLIKAVDHSDVIALGLRNRFAQNLEIAISGAVQLFSTNLVVLGGAAIDFGGAKVHEAANRSLQYLQMMHPLFKETHIVVSNLKPDPATVGAAALVIQAVLEGQLIVRGSTEIATT